MGFFENTGNALLEKTPNWITAGRNFLAEYGQALGQTAETLFDEAKTRVTKNTVQQTLTQGVIAHGSDEINPLSHNKPRNGASSEAEEVIQQQAKEEPPSNGATAADPPPSRLTAIQGSIVAAATACLKNITGNVETPIQQAQATEAPSSNLATTAENFLSNLTAIQGSIVAAATASLNSITGKVETPTESTSSQDRGLLQESHQHTDQNQKMKKAKDQIGHFKKELGKATQTCWATISFFGLPISTGEIAAGVLELDQVMRKNSDQTLTSLDNYSSLLSTLIAVLEKRQQKNYSSWYDPRKRTNATQNFYNVWTTQLRETQQSISTPPTNTTSVTARV